MLGYLGGSQTKQVPGLRIAMPQAQFLTKEPASFHAGLGLVIVGMLLLVLLYSCANGADQIIEANTYLPISFALILASAAGWRVKRDPMLFWCPLTWFCLGSAVAFGWGSLIYYFGDGAAIYKVAILYPASDSEILATNVLNSASVLFVVFGYSAGIRLFKGSHFPLSSDLIQNFYDTQRFLLIMLVPYLPFKAFVYLPYHYGLSEDAVSGVLLTFGKLGDLIVLLMFFLWGRGRWQYGVWGSAFCVLEVLLAMPSFGKGAMVTPVVAAAVGYFWGTKKIWTLAAGAVAALLLLTQIAAPLSAKGRAVTFANEAGQITLADRVEIITGFFSEFLRRDKTTSDFDEGAYDLWARNSFNNVQSYLMQAYDAGRPGHSLDGAIIAIVPRIVWPNKPNMTEIGIELDSMVKRLAQSRSSLAPTFNAEAYWNGGWWLMSVICALVGVQFAHFAVYARGYIGANDLRYLFVALAGVHFGLTIEAWIVSKYVGGYVTIWAIWFIIKRAIPWATPRGAPLTAHRRSR